MAKIVLSALKCKNAAGDAKDRFHTNVMSKKEMEAAIMGWRTAWQGKVCTALDFLTGDFPDGDIVALTIDGGPECVWELGKFTQDILPLFNRVHVMRHPDFASFLEYFEKGAPVPT